MIRHLLTHTGGTGDFFGPLFAKNRLTLKSHGDYVALFGSRGPVHEPGAELGRASAAVANCDRRQSGADARGRGQ
jgi:hypothetical protein